MRLVHSNMGEQNTPPARREKPQWVTVAEVDLWGDRHDDACTGDNMVESYGTLAVWCHRTPSTNLNTARYMLVLDQSCTTPMHVECSRHELHTLALVLLDAAQHAYPLELKRAGYEQCVAPWFDGNNGGGVA